MYVRSLMVHYCRRNTLIPACIFLVITVFFYSQLSLSRHVEGEVRRDISYWWLWPQPDSWDINNKIPVYDDSVFERVQQNTRNVTRDINANNTHRNENHERKKLILFIDPVGFFGVDLFPKFEEKCGCNCEVIFDEELHYKADVVVYHFTYMIEGRKLHSRSFPGQLYVWFCLENPWTLYHTYKVPLEQYDGLFNYTMTYRRDSDIYFPYYTLAEISEMKPAFKNKDQLLASKDSLAVWVSSNCRFTKGAIQRVRMMLDILELNSKVDMYGDCALSLASGLWNLQQIISKYKFYFAMENALHCRDYITEKTWRNSILTGTVPVIWGPTRPDVEAVLPPGSFILMEDFSTPEELVEYLQYLDENPKAYARYFDWMDGVTKNVTSLTANKFGQRNSKDMKFCQLCRVLQDDIKVVPNVVYSLHDWWYLNENKLCLTPRSVWEDLKGAYYANLLKWRLKPLHQLKGYCFILFLYAIGIAVAIALCKLARTKYFYKKINFLNE